MSIGRRQYPFDLIEPKWQAIWDQQEVFRAWNPGEAIPAEHPFGQRHGERVTPPPKFYVLDMFPYPSGAGLHVGHPEGYTATDILARYRRALGFNVLHPMGWDAFGLPAEQYAVKTGQHPRATTEANIATFKRQIKSLGFSYDWSREVDTTDPRYFKWTQWIFLQLYNSWYNPKTNKAEPISTLPYPPEVTTALVRRKYRDSKRLAYVAEAPVNWCPELGTVLANEEVIDGKSEVGGFPVIRKPMRQWMLRITAYAERLLNDLDTIDWSHSLKEMQRNWIGRSEGATVEFKIADAGATDAHGSEEPEDELTDEQDAKIGGSIIRVFTTRPDTLFGATYMVLSPEHRMVEKITTPEQREAVKQYQQFAAGKSDLERTELAKEKTGVFTGAYAINPVNGEKIPIWIADYVLATYGTGAIMAVPAHDERDLEFAKKFNLPIRLVVQAPEGAESIGFVGDGVSVNSGFITGLPTPEAKAKITAWLEEKKLGHKTINYKLRDWLFSRQRYWGEPFPIIWKNGQHEALPESALPVLPPSLTDYKPTASGEPPLARAKDWVNLPDGSVRETNTMPQWAGSCWYYLRYLDARNGNMFCDEKAERYWMGTIDAGQTYAATPHPNPLPVQGRGDSPKKVREVAGQLPGSTSGDDLYAGETEQPDPAKGGTYAATLHPPSLGSYGGTSPSPLPAKGRGDSPNDIQDAPGRVPGFTSGNDLHGGGALGPAGLDPHALPKPGSVTPGVDLYVGGTEHAVLHLLYARFWHKVLFDLGHVSTPEPFYKLVNQGLILGEDGQKMSKSRGNVVNPDDVLVEYGADAFRLYEMFMGPLEMVKPWNTKGVEGVYRFLGRVWRLFVDETSETEFEQKLTTDTGKGPELLKVIHLSPAIQDTQPTAAQLKTLHACIKKVTEALDALRFNTAISALMVFVNDAITWEVKPYSVMRDFLTLLQPFAPHLAEELFAKLKSVKSAPQTTLAYLPWPQYDAALLVESTLEIPVQVNGKLRDTIKVPADASQAQLEAAALATEKVKPFIEGKTVKKIIVVPKRLVNIVVG